MNWSNAPGDEFGGSSSYGLNPLYLRLVQSIVASAAQVVQLAHQAVGA